MSYINSFQIENSESAFKNKQGYYYSMRIIQLVKSCLIVALSISGIHAAARKIPPIILRHFRFTIICVMIYAALIVIEFVLMKILYNSIVNEMAGVHNVFSMK